QEGSEGACRKSSSSLIREIADLECASRKDRCIRVCACTRSIMGIRPWRQLRSDLSVTLLINWLWRRFGEGVDGSEKIEMNEDDSRGSKSAKNCNDSPLSW